MLEPFERMLSTDEKGALLILFHRNPNLKNSVQGLATLIGKTPREIAGDVNDLTELGLSRHNSSTGVELISWSREKAEEIQEKLCAAISHANAGRIFKTTSWTLIS